MSEIGAAFVALRDVRAKVKTAWRFCFIPHEPQISKLAPPESRRAPGKIRGVCEKCELSIIDKKVGLDCRVGGEKSVILDGRINANKPMNTASPAEEAIYNAARQFADPEKLSAYLDLACDGRRRSR